MTTSRDQTTLGERDSPRWWFFAVTLWLGLFFVARSGRLGPKTALDVEICGLYWHFVDIVWIIIFTLLYLIGGFDQGPATGGSILPALSYLV